MPLELHSLALEATLLMIVWLCLGVSQIERPDPGRRTFLALCLAGGAWCLGDLVLIRGLASELTADRIKYAGVLALPPLWLGFGAHAARLEVARRVPWFPIVLLVPQAFLFWLMVSGRWGSLFVVTIPGAEDRYGPLWWISATYSYALVMAGSLALIATAFRWRQRGEVLRRLAAGAAALAPLAVNGYYLTVRGELASDPTSLCFGVAILALRSAIFSAGLIEALPMSQHDLIGQLPLSVLLTDRRGTVLEANPRAQALLGIPRAKAVGRTLQAVLAEAGRYVRVESTPVRSRGREAGQLVLLDPPAKSR